MDIFSDYFLKIGNQFIDPKKRVFFIYIIISIIIAVGWFILNKKFSFKNALKKYLIKKYFFLSLLNQIIKFFSLIN